MKIINNKGQTPLSLAISHLREDAIRVIEAAEDAQANEPWIDFRLQCPDPADYGDLDPRFIPSRDDPTVYEPYDVPTEGFRIQSLEPTTYESRLERALTFKAAVESRQKETSLKENGSQGESTGDMQPHDESLAGGATDNSNVEVVMADPTSGLVNIVGVIVAKRHVGRLLCFLDIVPLSSVSEKMHPQVLPGLKYSWSFDGLKESLPVAMQLIIGRTMNATIGETNTFAEIGKTKVGQLVHAIGFIDVAEVSEMVSSNRNSSEAVENSERIVDVKCKAIRLLEERVTAYDPTAPFVSSSKESSSSSEPIRMTASASGDSTTVREFESVTGDEISEGSAVLASAKKLVPSPDLHPSRVKALQDKLKKRGNTMLIADFKYEIEEQLRGEREKLGKRPKDKAMRGRAEDSDLEAPEVVLLSERRRQRRSSVTFESTGREEFIDGFKLLRSSTGDASAPERSLEQTRVGPSVRVVNDTASVMEMKAYFDAFLAEAAKVADLLDAPGYPYVVGLDCEWRPRDSVDPADDLLAGANPIDDAKDDIQTSIECFPEQNYDDKIDSMHGRDAGAGDPRNMILTDESIVRKLDELGLKEEKMYPVETLQLSTRERAFVVDMPAMFRTLSRTPTTQSIQDVLQQVIDNPDVDVEPNVDTKSSITGDGSGRKKTKGTETFSIDNMTDLSFSSSKGLVAEQALSAEQQAMRDTLQLIFGDPNVALLGFGVSTDLVRLAASYPTLECFQKVSSVVELSDMSRAVYKSAKVNEISSLSKLCAYAMGAPLDKAQQCSPWHLRPFSEAQIRYAATDAAVLPKLFDVMVDDAPLDSNANIFIKVHKFCSDWKFTIIPTDSLASLTDSSQLQIPFGKVSFKLGNAIAAQRMPHFRFKTIPEIDVDRAIATNGPLWESSPPASGIKPRAPSVRKAETLKLKSTRLPLNFESLQYKIGRRVGSSKTACLDFCASSVPAPILAEQASQIVFERVQRVYAFENAVCLFINALTPGTSASYIKYFNEFFDNGRYISWFLDRKLWNSGDCELALRFKEYGVTYLEGSPSVSRTSARYRWEEKDDFAGNPSNKSENNKSNVESQQSRVHGDNDEDSDQGDDAKADIPGSVLLFVRSGGDPYIYCGRALLLNYKLMNNDNKMVRMIFELIDYESKRAGTKATVGGPDGYEGTHESDDSRTSCLQESEEFLRLVQTHSEEIEIKSTKQAASF